MYHLMRGRVYLPAEGVVGDVPLCRLGELGEPGYDRRDIHDGFTRSASRTAYPAFWGHDGNKVVTIRQAPNAYRGPRPAPAEGRPARDADHLWRMAGRLLIAKGFRLNTTPLIAVRVGTKVLSNIWWSFVPHRSNGAEELEKCLALWFNSTLGMLMFMGRRVETQGPWTHFKKPALRELPVLDPRALSSERRQELAVAYGEIATMTLGRLPEATAAPTRALIDAAVARSLAAPDLSILRTMLVREPILSGTIADLLPTGQAAPAGVATRPE